jgi:hypothetical protein
MAGIRFDCEPAVAEPRLEIDAAAIWPMQPGMTRWCEVDERGGRTPFAWTVMDSPTGGVRADEGGHRAVMIRETDSGGREAMAVDKPADDARTLFEPALALCPARLRCGEPFESTASARVVRASDGSERDHGSAWRRTELVGRCRLTCPLLGQTEALQVHTRLETRLRFAVALVETTRWIVPGHGPVAERTEERISVMGLLARERCRTVVRLPEPAANPASRTSEAH